MGGGEGEFRRIPFQWLRTVCRRWLEVLHAVLRIPFSAKLMTLDCAVGRLSAERHLALSQRPDARQLASICASLTPELSHQTSFLLTIPASSNPSTEPLCAKWYVLILLIPTLLLILYY